MKPPRLLNYLPFRDQPEQIQKLLILGGIYIATILLAPFIVRMNLLAIGITLAFLGLLGIVFFIRYPGVGFPLTIFSSLLIPFALSTGTQTRINSTILLVFFMLAAWMIDMIVIKREMTIFKESTVILAIAFTASAVISFGFGQLPWYPARPASLFAQIGQVLIFVLSSAAFILTIHQIKDLKWLKWTVAALIVAGGVYAVVFLIPSLRPYINRIFQRAVVDSLFWTWLIVLSLSQAVLNKDLSPLWRILSALVAAAGLINVFVIKQTWVSGWLPAGLAVIVMLFLYKPRIAVIVGLLFVVILAVRFQLLENYIFVGDNQYSMDTRLEAWGILFQIIEKNPLFGVGPANYYFYTPFYSILGYSVSFNSHNNYIDLLAQTGLIGFVLFIWWMIAIGKRGIQLLRLKLSGFEYSFTLAALGGLGGVMAAAFLGDWVVPFIYNVGMDGFRSTALNWIFLGGLVFLYLNKSQGNSKHRHG